MNCILIEQFYFNLLLAHMHDMLHLGGSHDSDTMRVLVEVSRPYPLFFNICIVNIIATIYDWSNNRLLS